MRSVRYHLSRVLFVLWTRIALRELSPPYVLAETGALGVISPPDLPVDDISRRQDRLTAIVQGRYIDDVWLPLGLERRLKAHLHRCNAAVTCAGWELEDFFDVREDLVAALLTAAKCGVAQMEMEDGVHYDEVTGLSLESLPQEM